VKKILVTVLITKKSRYSIQLNRRVQFEASRVVVEDRLSKSADLKVQCLELGRSLTTIHMAAANYFQGQRLDKLLSPPHIDVEDLNKHHSIDVRMEIEVPVV
jgi:hypothetical protein